MAHAPMFTIWIVSTIVSLAVLYILLRVYYPKQEEAEVEESPEDLTADQG